MIEPLEMYAHVPVLFRGLVRPAQSGRDRGLGCVRWGPAQSWNLDLADVCDGCALRDVERQQPERVLLAVGLDRPPDPVSAGGAGGERRVVAKRALVSFERGEDDAALVGRVTVVKQVTGHTVNLPRRRCSDIGAPP